MNIAEKFVNVLVTPEEAEGNGAHLFIDEVEVTAITGKTVRVLKDVSELFEVGDTLTVTGASAMRPNVVVFAFEHLATGQMVYQVAELGTEVELV